MGLGQYFIKDYTGAGFTMFGALKSSLEHGHPAVVGWGILAYLEHRNWHLDYPDHAAAAHVQCVNLAGRFYANF